MKHVTLYSVKVAFFKGGEHGTVNVNFVLSALHAGPLAMECDPITELQFLLLSLMVFPELC